jgi:quinone-modifying oxidoreductase subunit QmoB
MAQKLGVYICGGCDIGANLDVEGLAEFVKNGKYSSNCAVVKTSPVLCSPESKNLIQEDIKANELDGVVVCACSPRVKWDVFNFGSALVERVNLREQCVWSFQDDPAVPGLLESMAKDYIKMGLAKATKSNPPEVEELETTQTIMVMGGGFTGLNAALYAAKMGHDVVVVEKDQKLGGKAADMYKTFPLAPPYTEAQDTGVAELVNEVGANAAIKVMTGAMVEELVGAPGQYTAKIKTSSGVEEVAVGAVVLATGWVPQDIGYLEPMGYGKYKNVVTSSEFESLVKTRGLVRPGDSKIPESVAFILDMDLALAAKAAEEAVEEEPEAEQAPASAEGEEEEAFVYEDKEVVKHLSYSSEISSLVALKQAGYVREKNPDACAYILYDHMMVPGVNERYYKAASDDPGVMLSKAQVTSIKQDADGGLLITAKDTLLGGQVEIKADMVVLPTGMVPVTAHDPTMNFCYRQGPHFPDLELFDGFVDSNYICFPYETRRTGVYAAGCAHQPMTMALAKEDAAGAALKAVQCLNSINHGAAVHPRSGDLTYPVFNFVRCTQCKRCTEECPFGALDDDEKGTPKPNTSRCRRCGTCMGACPERVISFSTYNIDQIGTAIKEVEVPDDIVAGGPRVIVLACENDAYPALDMAAFRKKSWSPYVRFLPVRCLGSVNAIWVADAMSKGVDGVMLLGCKFGDDYQCHFVKGSELCNRRKENIAESLDRLGVEAERVEQYQVSIDEYDTIPELIDAFMEKIKPFGPNPFKGY